MNHPAFGSTQAASLTILTKAPNPSKHNEAKAIDIVAVHDLHIPGDTPWVVEDGSIWLRDFVPKDIRGARVFAFDWESSDFLPGKWDEFAHITKRLLDELKRVRDQVPESRPLVFICHGFGGLIVEAVSL
jgi:hypothetical protein